MSNRLEKLAALGCDVTGAMDRFLNDEEFYFSLCAAGSGWKTSVGQ